MLSEFIKGNQMHPLKRQYVGVAKGHLKLTDKLQCSIDNYCTCVCKCVLNVNENEVFSLKFVDCVLTISMLLFLAMFLCMYQFGLNELKLRFRTRLTLHLYEQYLRY